MSAQLPAGYGPAAEEPPVVPDAPTQAEAEQSIECVPLSEVEPIIEAARAIEKACNSFGHFRIISDDIHRLLRTLADWDEARKPL